MGPCVDRIAVDARNQDQDKRGCQLGPSAADMGRYSLKRGCRANGGRVMEGYHNQVSSSRHDAALVALSGPADDLRVQMWRCGPGTQAGVMHNFIILALLGHWLSICVFRSINAQKALEGNAPE